VEILVSFLPAFLVFYLLRDMGLYRYILPVAFVLPVLLFLHPSSNLDLRGTSTRIQDFETATQHRSNSILTAFSVITTISAVILNGRVLSCLGTRGKVISGLPLNATAFLLFVSSYVYVWCEDGKRGGHLFDGRPRRILILSTITATTFTTLSVFFCNSLKIYLEVMKAVFFLTFGAILALFMSSVRNAGISGDEDKG
jgi:hypothetical protein